MAGEIIAVGEDVKGWQVGERVMPNFSLDYIFGVASDVTNETALGGLIDGVLTEYKVVPAHVRLIPRCLIPFAAEKLMRLLLTTTGSCAHPEAPELRGSVNLTVCGAHRVQRSPRWKPSFEGRGHGPGPGDWGRLDLRSSAGGGIGGHGHRDVVLRQEASAGEEAGGEAPDQLQDDAELGRGGPEDHGREGCRPRPREWRPGNFGQVGEGRGVWRKRCPHWNDGQGRWNLGLSRVQVPYSVFAGRMQAGDLSQVPYLVLTKAVNMHGILIGSRTQ